MKLITESIFDTEHVIEEGVGGKKSHYIVGPFAQAEQVNHNGRMYPKGVLESQINIQQGLIKEKRALGELNHPATPTIDLGRVSHLITELTWSGNDVMGKAKILDTPCGNIARALLDEGIKYGVSTRGVGSVAKNRSGINEVGRDFRLVCVDLVSNPSGPGCWVNAIMENQSWIYSDASGEWIEAAQEIVESAVSSRTLDLTMKSKLFEAYLNHLGSNSTK